MRNIFKAALLCVFAIGMAHASVIPVFLGMSNLGGGVYAYNYDIFVESPGERIQFATTAGLGGTPAAGFDNHFTFFDFFGYVPGSASCAGSANCGDFTPSVTSTGPPAYQQLPSDTSAPNITWTDTATGVVLASGSYLGRFTMDSTSNVEVTIQFTGQSTKDTGPQDGTVTGNIVNTVGPGNGPTSAVPEPATLLLLGIGLIGLSLLPKQLARQ